MRAHCWLRPSVPSRTYGREKAAYRHAKYGITAVYGSLARGSRGRLITDRSRFDSGMVHHRGGSIPSHLVEGWREGSAVRFRVHVAGVIAPSSSGETKAPAASRLKCRRNPVQGQYMICGVAYLKIEIFCPRCAAVGIRRKLMEVDSMASGVIYPYCKSCKKNIKIILKPVKITKAV